MTTRAVHIIDPWFIRGTRAALYGVSLVLYLLPLSSWIGMSTAVALALLGMHLAGRAHGRHLRIGPALLIAPAVIISSLLISEWLVDSHVLASTLGIKVSLVVSEVLSFGLAAFAIAFLLRFLSLKTRALSLLEVLFVAGSAVAILADHRNRMLNRPRFFSDWAWTLGVNPSTVLMIVGILATLAAILLFLRGQPLLKLLMTFLFLILLGLSFYLLWGNRIESPSPPDALGLSGKKGGKGEKGGKGGKGEKGGGGQSDNPFKDSYSSGSAPSPVAIAILRDDFEPTSPVLYFRQNVLSSYNGHHLVSAAKEGRDRDVITEFPRQGSTTARVAQSPENHIKLPTTMYLLVDHPQPLGLTHSTRVTLVKNPNPQQFVAAYDVDSLILSVKPDRLLGRRSIPESWSAEKRAHYTALPDDPRYQALADIVVRDVDPRFFADDLAKAFAIKRYLEKAGFYTMKSKHASRKDPTASFLFGSLRGYCVHFAHSAVYMMRSQGLAARVALGYAVMVNKRSGGSSILIMSDRAHAWPEVHLDGIGWVTLDVYPERSDTKPPSPVDYDLEKLLGELARNDKTAGVSPDSEPLVIPWGVMFLVLGALLGVMLVLAYAVKAYRRLAPGFRRGKAYPRVAYIAVLDILSDLGGGRRRGETRERHAARLSPLSPHLEPLTRAHLALAMGGGRVPDRREFQDMVRRVKGDMKANVHPALRLLGLLNPIGWVWTR